uniref:Macro domain-containing protein n=1 Tax=Oncorhynchus tshawytscha TaxID=74940 RepID=A0AAZ3SI37_ONCTS
MSRKKKDWKTEKDRVLNMSLEERRKEYRRSEYVPLDQINTWKQSQSTEVTEEEEGKDLLRDKVSLYKGDITILEVDAIVNAANSSLLGGGGVDGCIHKAAGSCLYEECITLNGCETGNAKITCGYDLPAKYVIHTVGPVARGHVGETETKDLTACYQNSLELVKGFGLRSVAFPCISTGIYGFPNEPAANIALETVKSWVKENHDKIERVIFCVFLEADYRIYKEKILQVFQDNDVTTEEDTEDGQKAGAGTSPSKESRSKNQSEDRHDDDELDPPKEDADNHTAMEQETLDSQTGEPEEKKADEKSENKEMEKDATEKDTEIEKDTEKEKEKEKEKEMETDTSASEQINAKVESLEGSDPTETDSSPSKDPVDKKE